MERILITFCRFHFYIIKVKILTKNYVTFESLYPLQGITADYFDEEENFFESGSVPVVKKFVAAVIAAYAEFYKDSKYFATIIEGQLAGKDISILKELVSKHISTFYQGTNFKYFSLLTKAKFLENHLNYFLHAKYLFEDVFAIGDDLKIVENCMKIVIEQNVNEVFFVHFKDDIYAGTELTKKINLSDTPFSEELLLQEMLICCYSAPRYDKDKNPFQYIDFFEERFDSFDEQKKLGLFIVCNTDKNLYMYNKLLTKFWMNRY